MHKVSIDFPVLNILLPAPLCASAGKHPIGDLTHYPLAHLIGLSSGQNILVFYAHSTGDLTQTPSLQRIGDEIGLCFVV